MSKGRSQGARRVSAGAESWQAVAAVAGLSAAQVEMYSLNQLVIGTSVASVLAFYLAFIIALAVTAVTAARGAACRGSAGAAARTPGATLRVLVFAGISVALAWLCALPLPAVPTLGLCALGGAGEAVLFQLAFRACCALPLRESARCVLVSFAAAALAGLGIEALGLVVPVGRVAVLMALALAVPAAARFSRGKVEPSEPAAGPGVPGTLDRRRLVLQALELLLFSLVLGFLRGEGAEAWGSPLVTLASLLLRAVVAGGLLWLLGGSFTQERLSAVSQGVLVCVAVAFVALALAGEGAPWVMPALVSLARNVVLVLFTVTLLYVVRASGWEPMLAYGIGRGVHAAGTLVGIVLNMCAGELPGFVGISANVVLFAIACAFLAFAVTSMRAARMFGQVGDDGALPGAGRPVAPPEERVDLRCAELAASHALTDREQEVVRLIAKGRSRGYIASHLGISENTVRFHARHAYAKLEIHSKQELLTLLGME